MRKARGWRNRTEGHADHTSESQPAARREKNDRDVKTEKRSDLDGVAVGK